MRIPLRRRRRVRLRGNPARARGTVRIAAALALVALILIAFHVNDPHWSGDPMAPGPIRIRVLPPVPFAEQVRTGGLASSTAAPARSATSAAPSPSPASASDAAVPADGAITTVSGVRYLVDLRGRTDLGPTSVRDARTGGLLLRCSLADPAQPSLDSGRGLFVAYALGPNARPDFTALVAVPPVIIACRAKGSSG